MSSISATRYGVFRNCPLRYKYQYLYRLLQTKGAPLIIGTLYHEMLELYHSDNEAAARKIIADNSEHSEILEHLFTKYLDKPVLGNVLETEHEFRVNIPGVDIPLYGFIDRIDEDKGVEYKTTSKKWKDEDTDTIQTDIYLYVLMKKFGRPVPIVYSINNKNTKVPPQIIEVTKTEDEIIQLEAKIKQYILDVKASDFSATPGRHCFMCPWSNKGDGTCIESK